RPARGLDVGRGPRLRPECAQGRCRMERAGADLHVIRLQNGAAAFGPIGLEPHQDVLEAARLAHVVSLTEGAPSLGKAPATVNRPAGMSSSDVTGAEACRVAA